MASYQSSQHPTLERNLAVGQFGQAKRFVAVPAFYFRFRALYDATKRALLGKCLKISKTSKVRSTETGQKTVPNCNNAYFRARGRGARQRSLTCLINTKKEAVTVASLAYEKIV